VALVALRALDILALLNRSLVLVVVIIVILWLDDRRLVVLLLASMSRLLLSRSLGAALVLAAFALNLVSGCLFLHITSNRHNNRLLLALLELRVPSDAVEFIVVITANGVLGGRQRVADFVALVAAEEELVKVLVVLAIVAVNRVLELGAVLGLVILAAFILDLVRGWVLVVALVRLVARQDDMIAVISFVVIVIVLDASRANSRLVRINTLVALGAFDGSAVRRRNAAILADQNEFLRASASLAAGA
jgi:hypothetical protein